jgi:exonuclease III
MIVLAWNSRGLARPAAVRNLRAMVRSLNPSCIFIQETKINDSRVVKVVEKLGFTHHCIVPALGTADGLLLAWKIGVDIEVTVANQSIINVLIFSEPEYHPWMLTLVHGPPSKYGRIPFWDHLKKIAAAFSGPWLCCGDFNCIVSQAEKKGGRSFVESSRGELRNFLDNCSLIDLGFKGNSFTWTNKRMGRDNIKERLDRAVANAEWKRLFPKATIKHLPMLSSDHAPLVINSHEDIPSGPKPYRFEEAWTRDNNCSMVIKKAWVDKTRSPPQQSLSIRIKNVKVQLKWWNKFVFGSIQSRAIKVKDELERVQALDVTLENGIKEEKFQKEYDECLRREELLWRQKSRVTWLTTSDLNTKFFHITTLVRRRRNQICFLKNNSGSWVQGNKAIGTSFSSFFSELFKSSNPSIPMEVENLFSNVISSEENEEICNIPTEVEIKNAVFSMGSLKAPGPDGLPPLFYKRYWEIVKKEVIGAVQNFFYTGNLQRQLNYTYIALIPKLEGAAFVNQFRPISLSNVVYKIISKILASRLKPLLPKIISPWQGAFVPGRVIQDNTIIAQEVIHAMKKTKGKQGYMALKMDMEKAYDRIEWSLILKVME